MTAKEIEILDVIDVDGETVGTAVIDEIYQRRLPHRIAHVLIHDGAGKLACQIRSKNKSFCPGCYSTSVGGHVQSGELPEKAAKREMKEEIGKTGKLEFLFSEWYEGNGLKKLLFVFKSNAKLPFKLNAREVERIEYLDYDEIARIPKNKIHPELEFIVSKLISE